jgi:hypothetical protein
MKLTKSIATLIALLAGWMVLLGYFLSNVEILRQAHQSLLGVASQLAAVVVIVGAINLFLVHTKKLTGNTPGWFYSLFVLLGLIGVILLNLAAPFLAPILPADVVLGVGPASNANQFIFVYIQSAAGAAIAGLIFFFLVLAGYRVLGRRMTLATMAFVISGAITLLALAPWPTFLPNIVIDDTTTPVTTLRDLLRTVTLIPSIAGARGLLLGIALGVVATGLRVLLAQDRPYRE